MKLNLVKKGKLAEKEFSKILIDRGYETYKVPKTRWNNGEDIFGLFDIMAINKKDIIGVQVTCNSTRGKIKQLRQWGNHPKFFNKLLAVKMDGGVWREIKIERKGR